MTARGVPGSAEMQAGPYKQMRTDVNGLGVSRPAAHALPASLDMKSIGCRAAPQKDARQALQGECICSEANTGPGRERTLSPHLLRPPPSHPGPLSPCRAPSMPAQGLPMMAVMQVSRASLSPRLGFLRHLLRVWRLPAGQARRSLQPFTPILQALHLLAKSVLFLCQRACCCMHLTVRFLTQLYLPRQSATWRVASAHSQLSIFWGKV